jgi:hypothetical protein
MPNVAFIRPELARLLPQYHLIRDCISGEPTIKAAKELYLPRPNAAKEADARYDAYLKRAVYYNVTRRTLNGLVGQVFMCDPVIEVPVLLQSVVDNVNGAGVNLTQHAKKALRTGLAFSRAGLLVDYPETDGGASIADLARGRIRPTIHSYEPSDVINWRTTDRGADEILSLVVLAESYAFADDGFEMKTAAQLRVLSLDDAGNVLITIWRETSPTLWDGRKVIRGTNFVPGKSYNPKGADGNPLTEIDFKFIGSENNDSDIEEPNFYDIASLNIAHYRNSADYEEACFRIGQPTPVITGLTQEWVDEVLDGTVAFGSCAYIPLPVGGDAKLLQVEAQTMTSEAMDKKERQMVALGAKLVEQKEVQRTATEAELEASSAGSTLASTAKNVQEAYLWALKRCAALMGLPEAGIVFVLNTDFDIGTLGAQEQDAVGKAWQTGAITFGEMRAVLRKSGIATEDDEAAKEKIATETADAMALAMPENVPGDDSGA